jgi:hypothetical protein
MYIPTGFAPSGGRWVLVSVFLKGFSVKDSTSSFPLMFMFEVRGSPLKIEGRITKNGTLWLTTINRNTVESG